ncbi:MAG: carotenoid biosynthesis protein [Anaerolineae bacterium]|nr:carotenoid biosynthesis protein [Anaerolineae bacterium]
MSRQDLLEGLRANRLYVSLIFLWVAAMISLPIFRWVFGDAVLPIGVAVTVVIQSAAVLSVLWASWGAFNMLRAVVIVAALGWFVEFIGHTTGIPFGSYDYTALLQPQLGGVPLVIPLAWMMMMPPAWAAAQVVVGLRNRWLFVGFSALAFTAWDLFLDPQMVKWGFWVWEQPSGYFGIPWVNFLGWLLASSVMTAVVRPMAVPVYPLLAVYVITWLLESIGLLVFWGLPGPGIVGFGAMGVVVLLCYRQLSRRARS